LEKQIFYSREIDTEIVELINANFNKSDSREEGKGLQERLEGVKNEILFLVNIIQREIDVGLKVFLQVFVDSWSGKAKGKMWGGVEVQARLVACVGKMWKSWVKNEKSCGDWWKFWDFPRFLQGS
jgi:hypothetical protein